MKRAMLSIVLMCAGSAHATTYDLGELYPFRLYSFSGENLSGAFEDIINFTFTGRGNFDYQIYWNDTNVSQFSAVLTGPMTQHTATFNSMAGGAGELFPDGRGQYSIDLTGVGGAYFVSPDGSQAFRSGNYYFELVTPVPEANTWMMLLAGAGIAGWRLRRRLELHMPAALQTVGNLGFHGVGRE